MRRTLRMRLSAEVLQVLGALGDGFDGPDTAHHVRARGGDIGRGGH